MPHEATLLRERSEEERTKRNGFEGSREQPRSSGVSLVSVRLSEREGVQVATTADMSFRIGGADDREEGDEELFETPSSAVSGGESDDEDRFPDGGAGDQDRHCLFPPPPLRRMNSDSIYDMASMTAQPPAKKKGLSRHYEGRSQSFACMSEVRCLEDLQKKDNPYKQKIKSCKSYAALRGMAKTKPSTNS